ncbi:MAG: LamG domain-containing protein, partial [Verrucomicrobiota bacterium]
MRTGLHAVWSALRASWSLVSGLALSRVRRGGATAAPASAPGMAHAALLALALVLFSPSPASAQLTTSAQLNGAGNLVMPALPALGRAVTVEGWVYPRSHSSWQRIVDIGNGTAMNNIVLIASEGTSGRPVFSVLSGAVTAPNPIPLNTWTHVAGVVDSDRTLRLYINGRLVASAVATSQVDDVARSSNLVGSSNWPGESPLDGSLADVRLWNTARTPAQIQAGMTVGSISGATTGLIAAYPFGATGQAALADVSGNNRTLTASGTVVYPSVGPAAAQITTSAQLNGAGSLVMSSAPNLGGSITIEAWVNPRSHANWGRIVDIGTSANKIMLLASSTTTGRPVLYVDVGGANILNLAAPNPVPLNGWSHVAGVLNADRSAQLYVNGQLVASGTASQAFSASASVTGFVGASRNPDDVLLNASLADVRVWNAARTQAQIQAGMTVGSISGATSGLIAAYPFGATGQPVLNDVSGNNRTLTTSGTVQYQTAGPANPLPGPAGEVVVADLNGSGSLRMPPLPNFGSVFTVEAWVNPRSHRGYARIIDLANEGYPNDNIMLFSSDHSTTKPGLWIWLNGTDNATYAEATSPNPIPLNTWSHIAGTVESNGTLRLFVNGVQVATSTASRMPKAIARNVCRIGSTDASPASSFDGSISDVRIWSASRTQAQIQASMPAGSITGPASGLLAAYPLGQTGQPALNDVSGNNRTLTSVGGVQFRSRSTSRFSARMGGAGHLAMPSLSTVSLPITVETWVYPTELVGWARAVDLADGNGTMINLLTSSGSSGRPSLHVLSGWGDAGAIVATDALPLNTWTHLAGVIGADRSMKLYVNGVEAASVAGSGVPTSYNLASNRIGLDNYGGTTFFKGSIGDVRVWNTARTQAQIQANMAAGSISSAVTGLLGAYPFGATGQSALADVSGNNRILTRSGVVEFDVAPSSTPPRTSSAWSDGASGSFLSMGSTVPVTGAFTVEGWVRPTSYSESARLVDYGGSSDNILLVSSEVTSGKPQFIVNRAGSAVLALTAPDALPLNTWSHVAAVINADRSGALYVNGRLVASGTASQLP